MSLDEQVLCIRRWAFDRNVDHFFRGPEFLPADLGLTLAWSVGGLWPPLEIEFIERQRCEEDPRYLQIVPYIIVSRTVNQSDGSYRRQIFDYTRPNTGREVRLHNMHSIGVGGHINPIDSGEWEGTVTPSVMTYIVNCATREIEEELAYTGRCQINGLGWILDPSTDVGLVHVGAVLLAELEGEDNLFFSEDAMIDAGWVELPSLKKEDLTLYENWSKILLQSPHFDEELFVSSRPIGGELLVSSQARGPIAIQKR